MKKLIIIPTLLSAIVFMSCKKTRTCNCDTTTTETYAETPRSGGSTSSETDTNTGNESDTYSKVTKKEMRRLFNCNSRTETSVNTYTTGDPNYIIDVNETTTEMYNCKIK